MRISTQSFFERNTAGIGDLQQQLFQVQQKLGAGTKFLTPSDDPVASARAVGVSQSMAESAQYASSRGRAVQSLSLEESVLQTGTSVLQDVKTLIIQAGNGTMSYADRCAVATALEGDFAQLLRVANSDDGNGQYLFAGFKSDAPPFVQQPDGTVNYRGDTGQRLLQVDVARQIAGTDDGVSVFRTVQGSAPPVPAAGAANQGTGVLKGGVVSDVLDYSVSFLGNQYTVTAGPTSASGAFTPGQPITFAGLNLTITGAPANGDSFTVTGGVASPVGTNSGTGVVAGATVSGALDYTVTFQNGQYTVTAGPNTTTGTFTPGQPIAVAAYGLQLGIDGTPADADTFTVTHQSSQPSADIFGAMRTVITALRTPATTDSELAALQNALSTANVQVTNTHDNMLTVRSSLGSRLAELDALNASGEARGAIDQTYLSELQDLDYASAISLFSQRQTNLQAAEQTFARMQSVALFNYL